MGSSAKARPIPKALGRESPREGTAHAVSPQGHKATKGPQLLQPPIYTQIWLGTGAGQQGRVVFK